VATNSVLFLRERENGEVSSVKVMYDVVGSYELTWSL
jgi:hypothetical protein